MSDLGLDGLIVIGGNGSLSIACRLHAEHGLPIVGVPKTIDNDIEGTDLTFGFTTAVQIATDAIDRLHTTAESHDRVMVVEVMGRHTGWIATHAGYRRRCDRCAHPRDPVRHRRAVRSAHPTPRPRAVRLDRRRRRRRRTDARNPRDGGEGLRPIRTRRARRGRNAHRPRDRRSDRFRDARRPARPRPARRHPDRVRPGALDTFRRRRDRRRARRQRGAR